MEASITGVSDRPIAVSIARAAKMTTLSPATLRAYAKTARLRVARFGRRIIVPTTSLEEFLREATRA
jgi:hypothetical protein